MTMQRIDVIWRKMPLTFILGVLLMLSCQGKSETVTPTMVTKQVATTELKISETTTGNLLSSQTQTDLAINSQSTIYNPQVTENADNSGTTLHNISFSDNAANPEKKQMAVDVNTDTEKSLSTVSNEMDNHNDYLNESTMGPGNVRKSHSEKDGLEAPKESNASVFWGLLVTGLLLAVALIGGHVWKNHRCTKTKGNALAEESYVADEENQGNTLLSVAPLNQPESPEKPSQNGESLESVKIQNPPTTTTTTNGHSTTKADTEL